MKFKNIHIIINPAAGQDEPILSYLNKVFQDTEVNWEISITKREESASDIAKKLVGKTDLIAIYGGDGSVTEVVQALYGQQTPLAIIPGGTANVMAKELNIPQNTIEAIKLLLSEDIEIKEIDMGLVNGHPFIIRINLGIFADMVLHTDRELKNSFGQLAYGITTVKTLSEAKPVKYKMKIDGVDVEEEGVALTVTNSGSIGIENYHLLPDISVTDGMLDVILMNNTDLMSVLRLAGSTFLQTESEVLKHWKCKEINISMNESHTYICDDCEMEATEINIKVIPKALKIVVPILPYQIIA